MVETLKDLVQNMTFSSLAKKHDEVGVTETANSNNKIKSILFKNTYCAADCPPV